MFDFILFFQSTASGTKQKRKLEENPAEKEDSDDFKDMVDGPLAVVRSFLKKIYLLHIWFHFVPFTQLLHNRFRNRLSSSTWPMRLKTKNNAHRWSLRLR